MRSNGSPRGRAKNLAIPGLVRPRPRASRGSTEHHGRRRDHSGEKIASQVLLLEDALEQRLGRPVDLIDAGGASPFLALDIIRGERVFCADADRCDEFDLYVMRRAGDLAPFERERRRLLLQP